MFLLHSSVALAQTHNWHHNRHNHGRRWQKCPPSAPHDPLRSTPMPRMDGRQPLEQAGIIFWVVEGVYGTQSTPLFCQCTLLQHCSVLKAIHTLNIPPKYIRLLGGLFSCVWCVGARPTASCGALKGHFHRQRPWLAMVVLGRWRPTSDLSTVGIVKIVYGSNFYSYIDPIHYWHLIRQLKKEDSDLCILLLRCFFCPGFYSNPWISILW